MTKPLRPDEPSSVQTRSSREAEPRRSSKTRRSFSPRAQDRDDFVARVAECARDREHRGGPDAAGDAGDRAPEILRPSRDRDVRRVAEGAGDVAEAVALRERVGHLERGLPDGLHDESDGALHPVGVRDGQRDAFGARMRPNHDELPGTVAFRHARRLDLVEGDVLAQRSLDGDPEHAGDGAIESIEGTDASASAGTDPSPRVTGDRGLRRLSPATEAEGRSPQRQGGRMRGPCPLPR